VLLRQPHGRADRLAQPGQEVGVGRRAAAAAGVQLAAADEAEREEERPQGAGGGQQGLDALPPAAAAVLARIAGDEGHLGRHGRAAARQLIHVGVQHLRRLVFGVFGVSRGQAAPGERARDRSFTARLPARHGCIPVCPQWVTNRPSCCCVRDGGSAQEAAAAAARGPARAIRLSLLLCRSKGLSLNKSGCTRRMMARMNFLSAGSMAVGCNKKWLALKNGLRLPTSCFRGRGAPAYRPASSSRCYVRRCVHWCCASRRAAAGRRAAGGCKVPLLVVHVLLVPRGAALSFSASSERKAGLLTLVPAARARNSACGPCGPTSARRCHDLAPSRAAANLHHLFEDGGARCRRAE